MRNGFAKLTTRGSVAGTAMALVIAATSPAIAANWVNVSSLGGGLDLCLDKDSVETHADGLTHFATKFCFDDDANEAIHAVQCSQDWSGDSIAIRARSLRPKKDGSWLWFDQQVKSASMIGISAKTACGK